MLVGVSATGLTCCTSNDARSTACDTIFCPCSTTALLLRGEAYGGEPEEVGAPSFEARGVSAPGAGGGQQPRNRASSPPLGQQMSRRDESGTQRGDEHTDGLSPPHTSPRPGSSFVTAGS